MAGFLAKLFGRGEKKSFTFTRYSDDWGGTREINYLGVSQRHLTNNSLVMAAVFWAMRNVKQADPCVEEESEEGWERVPGHPGSDLVRHPQRNILPEERSRLTGGRLAAAMVYSTVLDGNAYLLKVRNPSGQVIGLDWIPHTAVEPVEAVGKTGVVEYYRINQSAGRFQNVPAADMVHHQVGIDPDCPVKGMSPLKSVMRQVMTDNQIAVYSHSVIKKPAPSMIVSRDAGGEHITITQDDADYLSKKFEEKSSGENAGGVVVPTFPAKVTPIGYSPEQMAIETLNRLPEERIAAVIGIPAIVLGFGAGLSRSTYSNMAEAREAATEEFLLPFWTDLAETLTLSLLPEFEKDDTRRFTFDTSRVRALTEDTDAVHARARDDFNANIINRAEARRILGLESETGDDKLWAYMLKPGPGLPPGLPQGPKDAEKVRRGAEDR